MSDLLYLQAVEWSTFESVFGGAKKPVIEAVTAKVNVAHLKRHGLPKLTDAQVASVATNAMTHGIDYASLSAADANLLDMIVEAAFSTKKSGIRTKAISAGGIGAPLLDGLEPLFKRHKATLLLKTFRNGRRFGMKPGSTNIERLLLSPEDVAQASQTLQRMASPDEDFEIDEDWADTFDEEMVRPFAAASKKGSLGIYGSWC